MIFFLKESKNEIKSLLVSNLTKFGLLLVEPLFRLVEIQPRDNKQQKNETIRRGKSSTLKQRIPKPSLSVSANSKSNTSKPSSKFIQVERECGFSDFLLTHTALGFYRDCGNGNCARFVSIRRRPFVRRGVASKPFQPQAMVALPDCAFGSSVQEALRHLRAGTQGASWKLQVVARLPPRAPRPRSQPPRHSLTVRHAQQHLRARPRNYAQNAANLDHVPANPNESEIDHSHTQDLR